MNLRNPACLLAVICLVFAGCLPSIHSVCTEEQLQFDDNLLGQWKLSGSPDTWSVTRHGDRQYRVAYTEANGKTSQFLMRLGKVNDRMWLDLRPDDSSLPGSGFFKLHLQPIHTVYLVRRMEPSPELAVLNMKALEQLLREKPDALAHTRTGGQILVTAATDQLQSFLQEHQDLFTGTVKLERLP